MLRFWTRFPLFLSLVIPLPLGCVECRAQSANAETVKGPILPANTPVILRLKKSLSKRDAKPGQPVEFEVGYDVVVNGQVVIQSGTAVRGSVRELDHTGKGPANVLIDLEPIQTVSEEVVRLTLTQIENASGQPGTADVVGWGAEAGPLLPAVVIASLFEKKVILPEGAYGVARVAENLVFDPVKQRAAQEQYTANEKAAQAELCKLLTLPDSQNWERISSLARQTGLDDSSKADLLRRAGDLDGAIEVYQQLLAPKQDLPCSVVPWLPLFLPFLGASEHLPAEVREQLSKSFHVALHFGLAEAFREKRDFTHAIAEYRAALQIDFDYEGSRIGLINALQDSGDLDAAIAESKEAIRIWPDKFYFHYLLGSVLVKKKDADAAIVELQWALKRAKNHLSPANCELGRAFEQKGDLEEAFRQYRTAFRAHVDDLQCRAAYQRLELQLKR